MEKSRNYQGKAATVPLRYQQIACRTSAESFSDTIIISDRMKSSYGKSLAPWGSLLGFIAAVALGCIMCGAAVHYLSVSPHLDTPAGTNSSPFSLQKNVPRVDTALSARPLRANLTSQDIHLLLDFSVDFESPQLLQHFIAHYVFMGVPRQNFLVILHSATEDGGNLEAIEQVLAANQMQPARMWTGNYLPEGKLEAERAVLDFYIGNDPDKWVVTASADELHVFLPPPTDVGSPLLRLPETSEATLDLVQTIGRAHKAGKVAITGHVVDRLTADCSLRDVMATQSPWVQFPKRAHVTRNVPHGAHTRVLAHSGAQRTRAGHTSLENGEALSRAGLVWSDPSFQTHLFKWTPTAVVEAQSRVEGASGGPAQSWAAEPERLLQLYKRSQELCSA